MCLRSWLGDRIDDGLKATTARSYRAHIENVIIPAVGVMRLRDPRPGHVERMLRDRNATGGPRPRPCIGSAPPRARLSKRRCASG
jgi:hypothetical protein